MKYHPGDFYRINGSTVVIYWVDDDEVTVKDINTRKIKKMKICQAECLFLERIDPFKTRS